jgi:2'-5' RNA ligase
VNARRGSRGRDTRAGDVTLPASLPRVLVDPSVPATAGPTVQHDRAMRHDSMPTMSMPVSAGGPVGVGEGLVTIGVSLEVPAPLGPYLQRLRAAFGDPMAQAIPAHVTLVPPTVVALTAVDAVSAHLAETARASAPFVVRLRGAGSFRPVSPVVYIRLDEGGEGCDALQRRVRTGPLARDLMFPYHPHVTVAHHLDDAALDHAQRELVDFAADFVVNSLALYEHGHDQVWRMRRRFAFRDADAGSADAGSGSAGAAGAAGSGSAGKAQSAPGRRP